MSSKEQYPARVEEYHGLQVTIYEIEEKDFVTGEDIGRCLDLENPRKKVNQIYNRNRDELEPHRTVLKLKTVTGPKETTVFSETGANLIAMFSRTPKAKDFRLWLAHLPRRVREAAAKVEFVNGEAVRQAFERGVAKGVAKGLALLESLPKDLLSLEEVGQLILLRRLNFTQREAAASLGISKDQVQVVEARLKEIGITFECAGSSKRRQQRIKALVAEVSGQQIPPEIPPGPPLAKGGVLRSTGGTPMLPEMDHDDAPAS